jgi:terminase small subunit / prophage DNA-packing protein
MRVKGQEQIAAMFGVAPKTITEWQVLGFPVAAQGGPGVPSEYDAPACIKWMVDREVGKVRAETPKDRLNRLQADKIEFELMKDRRLFVPADEVEPLWNNAVLTAREFLLGEPPRLAMLMLGKDKAAMQQMLAESFETFLTKLSQWQLKAEDDEAGEQPGEDEEAGGADE